MIDRINTILSDFVELSFEVAKNKDIKDSNTPLITPSVMALSEKQPLIMMLPWEDGESKLAMLQAVGEKCHEVEAYNVALISDAALKSYTHKITSEEEVPLAYPSSMRTDCFILVYIDFKDPKENFIRTYPYKKVDGKIVREPESTSKTDKISSILMESLSFGFIRAAMFSEFKAREAPQFDNGVGDDMLKCVLERYPGAALGREPSSL
jgi:hypothetical protein